MSLETISTLAGQFQSLVELQHYCDAQYLTLQKAQERIKQLESEVNHLKSVVTQSMPLLDVPQPELLIKSNEQSICEMEIERLRKTAMDRSLTLEETKRLDLLVKNLHLAKEAAKDLKPDYLHLPLGMSEAKLIEIARLPDPQESPVNSSE